VVRVIEKLDNNEHVLLMYLADELPAEDRLEVRQLLEVDTSLRREFEQLQAAHQLIGEQLAHLDDVSPLAVNADFAARQIGREIRQRLARPKPSPAASVIEQPVRSWRWLYPTIAAASIAMIAMVWLGHQAKTGPNPYTPAPGIVKMPDMNPSPIVADAQQADPNVTLLIQSLQPADDEPKQDEPKQVAVVDGMPQDDVSQYLLDASAPVK
jgi:hypothetical protein